MGNIEEFFLNGILESESDRYYQICFFGDRDGVKKDAMDHYVFVPKPVCRILDRSTVAIQDWYVRKNDLMRYVKNYQAPKVTVDLERLRLRKTPVFRERSS